MCAINVSTSSTVLSPTSLGQMLQITSIVFYHTVQIQIIISLNTCVVIAPFNVTFVRTSGIHFPGHHISYMAVNIVESKRLSHITKCGGVVPCNLNVGTG